MFVTLLVWLSISNGERGLEEMLGWSLVCFGICGLQSIWSIQGEEIEAYAETLTISFKNRRTIPCVMIWWQDIGMISISYHQFSKVSMEHVASVINIISIK
jgi:hypothetical protein